MLEKQHNGGDYLLNKYILNFFPQENSQDRNIGMRLLMMPQPLFFQFSFYVLYTGFYFWGPFTEKRLEIEVGTNLPSQSGFENMGRLATLKKIGSKI